MNTNIITAEEREIYKKVNKIIKEERKDIILPKIKQKIIGLSAIGVSIAEIILGYTGVIDEGGAFIFMLPLGLYALFTRENIVN